MYPDGYAVTRSCKNNFALNEDGKTKCDFKTTGMIKPSLLTFKNNKKQREMVKNMMLDIFL